MLEASRDTRSLRLLHTPLPRARIPTLRRTKRNIGGWGVTQRTPYLDNGTLLGPIEWICQGDWSERRQKGEGHAICLALSPVAGLRWLKKDEVKHMCRERLKVTCTTWRDCLTHPAVTPHRKK